MAAETWLFQQFQRPAGNGFATTTMEIKGDAPVLWVERQGQNLDGVLPPNQLVSTFSATISDSFPCTGNEGPCNVQLTPHLVSSEIAGKAGCDLSLTLPEWVSIVGDNVMTPAVGIIVNAHFAIDDDASFS